MLRIVFLALASLIVLPAAAQTPALPYVYPVAVGAASAQAIGANPARRRIEFYNPNDAIKIAVCPQVSRANSALITCAVNGAGSVTLLPYQSYRLDGVNNGLVNSAWNAIGSGNLTIFEWE